MSELGDLMREISKRTGANIEDVMLEATIKMCGQIVKKTPRDNGLTQNAWHVTSSRPSKKVVKREKGADGNEKPQPNTQRAVDTIEKIALKKMERAINRGTTFFVVNNQPNASVLEYGLYPKNVKRGSPIRGSKPTRYEVRSINGYSKQAPAGMVRLTVKEYKRDLNKLIKKLRNKK